jgi:creatinine amidohydrolase
VPGPSADEIANDRPFLLTEGMAAYTHSGIIGRPSLATAAKGVGLLDALSAQFKDYLHALHRMSDSA